MRTTEAIVVAKEAGRRCPHNVRRPSPGPTPTPAPSLLARKKPVVFAPAQNNARHPPPKPHQRSVRDPKIPIGRAKPNQTAPFPPRGFLLTRLSDDGPAPSPARLQRAVVRNPSVYRAIPIDGGPCSCGTAVKPNSGTRGNKNLRCPVLATTCARGSTRSTAWLTSKRSGERSKTARYAGRPCSIDRER
jgi:hypothetical protein